MSFHLVATGVTLLAILGLFVVGSTLLTTELTGIALVGTLALMFVLAATAAKADRYAHRP